MAIFPGHAVSKSDDPLAIYRDRARVLLVVSPTSTDSRLAQQRRLFAGMKHGAAERDLALVEALGTSPEAQQLRLRFGLPAGFNAVLIGKDGGSKLVSGEPLASSDLFPVIDAMPMRQREMQTR